MLIDPEDPYGHDLDQEDQPQEQEDCDDEEEDLVEDISGLVTEIDHILSSQQPNPDAMDVDDNGVFIDDGDAEEATNINLTSYGMLMNPPCLDTHISQ